MDLTYCELLVPLKILVNTDSGSGLLPYGTKPLPGTVFYLHSSLLKLSKLWDPNLSFNYLEQIHFLSQCFENLLKQGT